MGAVSTRDERRYQIMLPEGTDQVYVTQVAKKPINLDDLEGPTTEELDAVEDELAELASRPTASLHEYERFAVDVWRAYEGAV